MKEYAEAVSSVFKQLGKEQPETIKAFQKFMQASKKEGALSHKFKELIGISLSVAKQCRFCIAFHISNALEAGATRDEIIEAAMVAISMDGGPSLMNMRYVLKALEDFKT